MKVNLENAATDGSDAGYCYDYDQDDGVEWSLAECDFFTVKFTLISEITGEKDFFGEIAD